MRSDEVLIIFDNCDLILANSSSEKENFIGFVDILLSNCNNLHVVFTTRIPLTTGNQLMGDAAEKIYNLAHLNDEDAKNLLLLRSPRIIHSEEIQELLASELTKSINKRFLVKNMEFSKHPIFDYFQGHPQGFLLFSLIFSLIIFSYFTYFLILLIFSYYFLLFYLFSLIIFSYFLLYSDYLGLCIARRSHSQGTLPVPQFALHRQFNYDHHRIQAPGSSDLRATIPATNSSTFFLPWRCRWICRGKRWNSATMTPAGSLRWWDCSPPASERRSSRRSGERTGISTRTSSWGAPCCLNSKKMKPPSIACTTLLL